MEENEKLNLDWSAIEKALAEGTYSGYKMGVIEAHKLFDVFLYAKKIPGKTVESKIKYIKGFLSRAEQLKYSLRMYKKIVEQPSFEITRDETKQVIGGFWQAMLDLEEAIATISTGQKIRIRLKYYAWLGYKKIRLLAIAFLSALAVVFVLNETAPGRKIALSIGSTEHYLIYKAGPWVLGAMAAISLLWFGWKMISKRGKEF